MQGAAGHAVGEEQSGGEHVCRRRRLCSRDGPGDSSSDAGYQATDEHEDGDDEVLTA